MRFFLSLVVIAISSGGGLRGVTLDPNFNPVIANKRGVAISQFVHLPAGGFIAVGEFVQAQGKWTPGVVKLSEAGEVVDGFSPPVTSAEAAVVDTKGRVYLQTQYTRLAGYGPVLRVGADGTLDPAFKISSQARGKMYVLSTGELMLVSGPNVTVYDDQGRIKAA